MYDIHQHMEIENECKKEIIISIMYALGLSLASQADGHRQREQESVALAIVKPGSRSCDRTQAKTIPNYSETCRPED